MSNTLDFIKKECWQETASEFAGRIEACLGRDYREEVPIANDGIRTRYRIDPKYAGYSGIAYHANDIPEILGLIADELKKRLDKPNVRVVLDDTLPRAYTHFLVYV